MANSNQMQPSGLPPIGTTTATSIGMDYTLGKTRSLESPAGRAERMARRYIRKFGDAGKAAAVDLLRGAAAARSSGLSLVSQADRAKMTEQQKVAEQSALQRGQAVDQLEAGQVNPNATSGAGRGTPLGAGGQPDTSGLDSYLSTQDYFRTEDQRQKNINERQARMKRPNQASPAPTKPASKPFSGTAEGMYDGRIA
jgi:hypothetical protein